MVVRRMLLKSLGIASIFTVLQNAETKPQASSIKVAYHLCDLDRVEFVLGNIANHVNATKGWERRIVLVVHGPALRAFVGRSIDDRVAERTAQLLQAGVGFEACKNTLKSAGLTLADLVSGFASAEQGGVVRLAELQSEGFAYIRP